MLSNWENLFNLLYIVPNVCSLPNGQMVLSVLFPMHRAKSRGRSVWGATKLRHTTMANRFMRRSPIYPPFHSSRTQIAQVNGGHTAFGESCPNHIKRGNFSAQYRTSQFCAYKQKIKTICERFAIVIVAKCSITETNNKSTNLEMCFPWIQFERRRSRSICSCTRRLAFPFSFCHRVAFFPMYRSQKLYRCLIITHPPCARHVFFNFPMNDIFKTFRSLHD